MKHPRSQSGVTLVELVITITIVAIATTAVLGAFTSLSSNSATALVQQQAAAIGGAYLEEALLKSFVDPDGVETGEVRSTFDDVDDYNGLDDLGARNQLGAALPGLSEYRVTMTAAPGSLGGLSSVDVLRIDVIVRHPAGVPMTFTGYRTRY
jgi:MSHA pilin protein MshD